MADPLIATDHVVAEWDAVMDGWSARDWTAGPAGIVTVELDGGVTLDIDVADPSTFVGLWVAARTVGRGPGRPGMGAVAAVEALLGPARAGALFALSGSPGRATVLADDAGAGDGRRRTLTDTSRHPDATRGSAPRSGVDPGLARLGLAVAAATDPSAGPLVRGLGHLDAARAASTLPGGLGRRRRARPHAAVAAELLLDLHRRHEIDRALVDTDAVAVALDGIGPVLGPDTGAAVGALAADLRRRPPARRRVQAAAERAAPMVAASMPSPSRAAPAVRRPAGRLVAVDRRRLPHAFAADAVAARQTTPSEVEVRVRGRAPAAEGWWARAFAADGVIVAAAPFRAAATDAVARLLVPPAAVPGVEIDVTDRPGEPRPSAIARSVVAAVGTGQAAARAERLGDAGAAADRWRRCAAAWRTAGDDTRAARADEHAAGDRRAGAGRPPAPLLADRPAEAATA